MNFKTFPFTFCHAPCFLKFRHEFSTVKKPSGGKMFVTMHYNYLQTTDMMINAYNEIYSGLKLQEK